jgi:hypothetical protein
MNTIGVMLMAPSIIDKKSPRRGWQEEHRATDLRRRTRRKSPSLSLGRLDLSSWYFLKHSKIDISQKDEISCRTDFAIPHCHCPNIVLWLRPRVPQNRNVFIVRRLQRVVCSKRRSFDFKPSRSRYQTEPNVSKRAKVLVDLLIFCPEGFRCWHTLLGRPNETKISHRSLRRGWFGMKLGSHRKRGRTRASGWLHQLLRCGRRYHARGAVGLPLRIKKTSDMANMTSPKGQTIRASTSAKKEISGTRVGCGRSAMKSAK